MASSAAEGGGYSAAKALVRRSRASRIACRSSGTSGRSGPHGGSSRITRFGSAPSMITGACQRMTSPVKLPGSVPLRSSARKEARPGGWTSMIAAS
ncbi:Uncharacterised protein [Mycobacteroides abscessus subsp. abscessus]|nr:Uncharacterised protein [Mycobacteroides abscessus subsp. abscessus]